MAKISIWNIGKANAELNATADVLAPALAKAGVQTIAVDGKAVPAAEAPVSLQVAALLTAQPAVDGAQNAAEALVSNELISKELETTKTELALKVTAVESLSRDKAALETRVTTAEASVQSLTTQLGVMKTERDACSNQHAEAAKQVREQKLSLARKCVQCGCVEFKGADGKVLAADCSDADLTAASQDLAFASLADAYSGALNVAASKVGVSLTSIPAGSAGSLNISQKNVLAQYEQITDPQAKTKFYRENKSAIDSAFRN